MPFVYDPRHHPYPTYSCCYCQNIGPLIYHDNRKVIICDYCGALYRGLSEDGILPDNVETFMSLIDTCSVTWDESSSTVINYIVHDPFTGPDDELIADHPPRIYPVGWDYVDHLVIGQDWKIVGNRAQAVQLEDGVRHFQVGDTLVSDNIRISVEFTMPANGDAGIAFRLDNTGVPGSWTYFKAIWVQSTGVISIIDPNANVDDSDTLTFDSGDDGRITVELNEDSIIATFENLTQSTSAIISASDSDNLTETHHGMIAKVPVGGNASLHFFDNFFIEAI